MSLKIVIVGAGEVGYNLTKTLSKEDYDITVIDIDPVKCLKVNNAIDARVIEGNGASQRVLQQIDVMSNVDYFLSLTPIDEINLIASKTAKTMGAKKVIARLRSTEFSHKEAVITPMDFLIDYVTYPEKAAQIEIESLIRSSSTVEVVHFKDKKITLLGIKIEESSPLIGRTIKNVALSNPFIPHKVAVVDRNDSTFIPHDDIVYAKNDVIYFVCNTDDVPLVQKLSGKPIFNVNNIMILGAGKIGRLLAKSLQYDYNVKIIENDKIKAAKYAPTLKNTLILVGDGLDPDLLESENIFDIDCFVAVTENQQTNMMASMLIKDYNVKQIIVHISTTKYIKPIRRMGIDAIVSKNISAVNEVVKFIQTDQQEIEISRFEDIDVDSIEIEVLEDCRFLTKSHNISDLPENICLAAIIRQDNIIIPNLNTSIKVDDKLLIFLKPQSISKVENLFQ